jgi:hypothetical protein
MFRFAPLDDFLAQTPGHLLFSGVWRQPGQEGSCSLF